MTDVHAPSPPPVLAPTFALVVGPGAVDDSANGLHGQAELFGFDLGAIRHFRLVHLRGDLTDEQLDRLASTLLVDPVGQWWRHAVDHLEAVRSAEPDCRIIEVGLRPGVTDREGAELVRAAAELGLPVEEAGVGRRYVIEGALGDDETERLADQVLHNEVVERWAEGLLSPAFTDPAAKGGGIDTVTMTDLDDDALVEVGRARRLGMSLIELRAVQEHYRAAGTEPTDGELETIAQTWSEHCSHKTFRGAIRTPDGVGGRPQILLEEAVDRAVGGPDRAPEGLVGAVLAPGLG
ncbi:MAG: phosphoribosylformylglycinamidine synthase subunit PurS, partial [Actinomycetota bacterium]